MVPADAVLVSESGIRGRDDVASLAAAGVDAVLIGESFVTDPDPEAAVRRLADVPLEDGRRGAAAKPGTSSAAVASP